MSRLLMVKLKRDRGSGSRETETEKADEETKTAGEKAKKAGMKKKKGKKADKETASEKKADEASPRRLSYKSVVPSPFFTTYGIQLLQACQLPLIF